MPAAKDGRDYNSGPARQCDKNIAGNGRGIAAATISILNIMRQIGKGALVLFRDVQLFVGGAFVQDRQPRHLANVESFALAAGRAGVPPGMAAMLPAMTHLTQTASGARNRRVERALFPDEAERTP